MQKSLLLTFSLIIFLLAKSVAIPQQQIDSLLNIIKVEQSDSLKLNLLIDLSRYYNKDIRTLEQCEDILGQALEIATRDSNYVALARVYNSYGILYRNIAKYELALDYHNKSLLYAVKVDEQKLIATAYNSIGVVYRRIDNHPKATQFHILGLKAAEIVQDTSNISVSLNSLGNIYSLNGQYTEAFTYFKRALSLARKMNNILGQAINYNNIGEVFEFMGEMDSALVYYTKSLEANKLIESKKGIAISYNAIGKIYLHFGRIHEAFDLINQALEIDIELGDKKFIADSYINLGRAYIALNKTDKAEKYSNLALDIAQEIGSITHTQWALNNLSEIYTIKNNPARAFYYYKMASKYQDSLINEKNTRAIAMMEVMFDSEKKEKEIQILIQTQEINEKEIARQVIIRNFYLAGFIFALALVVVVLFALDVKRKANRVLAQQKSEIEKSHFKLSLQQNEILNQNQEIEKQRNSIEQKNKYLEDAYRVIEGYIGKITDSIRYAERIQKAILPPVSISKDFFADFFSLYKPKDFVSGDFYWLTIKDQTLFVAVADCTGHGVPGAFMSIIGMDLLSQAVNQQNIVEPAEILDFLNIELRTKLRKEDEEELILKDSMDLAIFSLSLGESALVYSGALVPLTIIRNKKILEFKPDFTSIGTSTKLFNRPFNQQSIDIKPGDWIYLYSDGLMDQFGGEENTKFMRKRFFDALIKLSTTSGENHRAELSRIFTDWKGNGEQIDDVLVLGLKV